MASKSKKRKAPSNNKKVDEEDQYEEGLTVEQIQARMDKAWAKRSGKGTRGTVFWPAEFEEFVLKAMAQHMKATNATMKSKTKSKGKGGDMEYYKAVAEELTYIKNIYRYISFECLSSQVHVRSLQAAI